MIKLKSALINPDYNDRSHYNGQYAVYNMAEGGPQIAAIVDHNILAILKIIQPVYNRNPERFMDFIAANAGGIISAAHSCVPEAEAAAAVIPEWAIVPLIGYSNEREEGNDKVLITYMVAGEGARFLKGTVSKKQSEGLKRIADDYKENPLLYYLAITRHHLKFMAKIAKEGLI